MKLTDGLFIRCAREAHEARYPEIEYDEVIIDAGCMRIVRDPSGFDILLCENLYGDVMSDLFRRPCRRTRRDARSQLR